VTHFRVITPKIDNDGKSYEICDECGKRIYHIVYRLEKERMCCYECFEKLYKDKN